MRTSWSAGEPEYTPLEDFSSRMYSGVLRGYLEHGSIFGYMDDRHDPHLRFRALLDRMGIEGAVTHVEDHPEEIDDTARDVIRHLTILGFPQILSEHHPDRDNRHDYDVRIGAMLHLLFRVDPERFREVRALVDDYVKDSPNDVFLWTLVGCNADGSRTMTIGNSEASNSFERVSM